jgi:hypothetical protein
MRALLATRIATVSIALSACSGDFVVKPIYNHANGRVVVELSEDLDGRSLYVRTRRGNFGTLDCAKLAQEIEPVAGASGDRIDGPVVDQALTKPFYGPEWGAGNPTPEMLAQLANGTDSIDVCLEGSTSLLSQRDLFQAWDEGRKRHRRQGRRPERRTRSTACSGALRRRTTDPFFQKNGDGSYDTYDCLNSTEIPMTATNPDGSVTKPQMGTLGKCDKPQYIYSMCEAGPRVAERTNDQGTHWVLLCRKSIGGLTSNQYNDIAMVGHNPFTGKTCFFQNALYSKIDGGHVPHPADKDKSTNLPRSHLAAPAPASSATASDADPFIHSHKWIDGARRAAAADRAEDGRRSGSALGANDTPLRSGPSPASTGGRSSSSCHPRRTRACAAIASAPVSGRPATSRGSRAPTRPGPASRRQSTTSPRTSTGCRPTRRSRPTPHGRRRSSPARLRSSRAAAATPRVACGRTCRTRRATPAMNASATSLDWPQPDRIRFVENIDGDAGLATITVGQDPRIEHMRRPRPRARLGGQVPGRARQLPVGDRRRRPAR